MAHVHNDSRSTDHTKKLAIVLSFTSAYMVAEVVGGIVTKSLALLADAGHMLTDVGGLALALVAIKWGSRPADARRSYGYYRLEILAAVINAVALLGISIYVLYEAYQRFRNPPPIESGPMLIVAGIGLVVNVAGFFVLRSGAEESLNMKGAYFEVLSDLLTSIGVIIAGVIMLTTGWYYADPILSAGIGLFIFPRTFKLLKEAVDVLLEATPAGIDVDAIRKVLAAQAGVDAVHDLHVWSLSSGRNALSVHLVLRADSDFEGVRRSAHEAITRDFKIGHVTIQCEREPCAKDILHA